MKKVCKERKVYLNKHVKTCKRVKFENTTNQTWVKKKSSKNHEKIDKSWLKKNPDFSIKDELHIFTQKTIQLQCSFTSEERLKEQQAKYL